MKKIFRIKAGKNFIVRESIGRKVHPGRRNRLRFPLRYVNYMFTN
jgi:hypothetical protein